MYRTSAMTHSDVALNVESRSSCESERLHVSIDHGLVHGLPVGPGALELGDQLLIRGTSKQMTKFS